MYRIVVTLTALTGALCIVLLAATTPASMAVPDIIWPVEPDILDGVFYLMHVDHNPAPNQIRDYQCNDQYVYDGHTGTDISAYNFRSMDRGVPILAAADGVVAWVRSDQFDRNFSTPYRGDPNGIIINHADGSHTQYWHLRQHSVSVRVGETVKQGQPIAYMGSSGATPIPHLHFEVWATPGRIQMRDPLNGSCSNDGMDVGLNGRYYPGDSTLVMLDWDLFLDTNLKGNEGNNFFQEDRLKERPLRPAIFGVDLPTLGLWVQMQASPGATYEIRLIRPDGTVFSTRQRSVQTKKGVQWHVDYWPFASAVDASATGTWTAELWHNDRRIGHRLFDVGGQTDYAPRFYPLSGKSMLADGSEKRHTMTLSGKEGDVTLRLDGAPPGVSLDAMDIVLSAGFRGTYRNTNFNVIAEDAVGRTDTFHVHLVDYTASVNPILTHREQPESPRNTAQAFAYPNPASNSTNISLRLATSAEVSLSLYDILGRKVRSHQYGRLARGPHTVTLDLSTLPAGPYVFQIHADEATWTGQLTRLH